MFREVRPSPHLRDVVDRFWLCDDALSSARHDPFEVAVAAVQRHAGDIRVAQLVELASLGRRQLERQFRDAVGLSPKQFCRAVRFQHVLAKLRGGQLNRAALAAELGFTDQSHLRRDFMALANRGFSAERHHDVAFLLGTGCADS